MNKLTGWAGILLISVLLLSACGGSGGSAPEVDNTAPAVLATPAVLPLTDNAEITLSFSETIDTATLVLAGDLVAEGNGGLWSNTTVTDDTLTISPSANWTSGTGRTLLVDADDLAGNAMTTLTLTYDIYNGTIYFVSATASDDTGDGLSPATAKQTITSAITAASAPAVVLVNAGTYNVNSDMSGTPTHIVLVEGVSLYGGYNPDFTNRDTTIYASIITDNSNYITAAPESSNRAVEAGAGITGATVIDGFILNGSTQAGADYTAAIMAHSDGAPKIQNNTLNGGNGSLFSTGLFSFGVLNVQSSAPTVVSNIINGGSGSFSHAIDLVYSSALITDNTVNGGTGGVASGVSCRNWSDPIIRNNIINGGNGSGNSYGMRVVGFAAPVIISNSINGGDTSNTTAIYTESASPSISKNTIHGGNGTTSSYGVFNVESAPDIFNNTIYGGNSGNVSYGIANGSATSIIRNNIIDGGAGLSSYGVIFNTNAISIDNNIIFTSGGSSAAYCLYEEDAAGDPASVRNNNLYACDTALFLDYGTSAACGSGATCITSITNVNALADTTASDNISDDPAFVDIDGADNDINTITDNDWHFSILSPVSVTAGGLNGEDDAGWGFTDDMNDITRPGTSNPWSMGAYEP